MRRRAVRARRQLAGTRSRRSPSRIRSAAERLASTAEAGDDRDVGGGERGGVVEAVADHQHAAARGARARRARATFSCGVAPGRASRRCRAGRRARRPGPRRRRRAARPAGRRRASAATVGGGVGAELVGEAEGDRRRVADPQPGGGDRRSVRARRPSRRGRAGPAGRPRRPSVPRPGSSAMSVDRRAGDRRAGRLADRAGQRVGAAARPARRRRRSAAGGIAAALVRTGRPVVSVPVLSKTTVSISASRSSAVPSLSSTPARNSRPEAAVSTAGHREAEAAGAGDDQHRGGDVGRLAPVAGGQAPPGRAPATARTSTTGA